VETPIFMVDEIAETIGKPLRDTVPSAVGAGEINECRWVLTFNEELVALRKIGSGHENSNGGPFVDARVGSFTDRMIKLVGRG
jgi:hypothetical protein